VSSLRRLVGEEIGTMHPRVSLARLAMAPLPHGAFRRVRAAILSLTGFDVGHGVLLAGRPIITGAKVSDRLHIADRVEIGVGCLLDLADHITIGRGVVFGPNVSLITGTHELGTSQTRAGQLRGAPIVIEDGVWVGAGCTVLAGVTIGSGSVVAAGATVARSVPPDVLVGGVPARIIRHLDSDSSGPSI
jgi:maltose O-acetyltransferase